MLRIGHIALFAYGFAKNDRENISSLELIEFRELAKELFQYAEDTIANLITKGELEEICKETFPNLQKQGSRRHSSNG